MLLIGSKWRYAVVPEGCDFLVSQQDPLGGLNLPERQFQKIPARNEEP